MLRPAVSLTTLVHTHIFRLFGPMALLHRPSAFTSVRRRSSQKVVARGRLPGFRIVRRLRDEKPDYDENLEHLPPQSAANTSVDRFTNNDNHNHCTDHNSNYDADPKPDHNIFTLCPNNCRSKSAEAVVNPFLRATCS